jgi:hypothetical protein
MSKERGEELFWALHSLLDAVTNLNLRDLEAEAKAATSPQQAKAESSTQGADTSASASAKGKAKNPDPDWTEVPYNPVPITPLSTRPRFSQVVGSSSESPIVPPSRVSIEAVSLADNPVTYSPAVLAAWAAMNNPGGGQDAQNQGGGPQGGGNGDGIGDGQGENGTAQDGGGRAPLAYNNAGQFLAAWNTAPTDQARDALEQEALSRSPAQDVQFAAMLKTNLWLQASVGQLTIQVLAAQGQVAAANVLARQAQAASHGAANVDRFRPAAPPKYGDKKKGEHVGHWISVIEIIFEVLSSRIISNWHPPIWRVDPVPCGKMCMRRTRGQMEGMSPQTLVSSSVRRLRPTTVSRIWTRSTGTPGTV